MIWSQLVHLGFNFWDDRTNSASVPQFPFRLKQNYLRCSDSTWNAVTESLRNAGANQVIIDLGEGVRFDSHPELAVADAWTKERLTTELARLRTMGLEPIPKLNFSAGHDEWMGEYARMISTSAYYEFCRDLIAETIEMFRGARYFHIGMDEENLENQREYSHAVIRQHELWFSDLQFYADEVLKRGARPWMWSDMMWENEFEFANRVSRDIVQSNWYYGLDFHDAPPMRQGEQNFQKPADISFFEKLDKAGFDQVPAGSNFANSQNMTALAKHCRQVITPERLLGFMQTTWYPTVDEHRDRLVAATEQLGEAKGVAN